MIVGRVSSRKGLLTTANTMIGSKAKIMDEIGAVAENMIKAGVY